MPRTVVTSRRTRRRSYDRWRDNRLLGREPAGPESIHGLGLGAGKTGAAHLTDADRPYGVTLTVSPQRTCTRQWMVLAALCGEQLKGDDRTSEAKRSSTSPLRRRGGSPPGQ